MPPANQMLLGALAVKNALYAPDKWFLVETGRRCSFREFNQRSDALAAGLLARGLGPGQRVAVIQHNSIELVEVYFGVMKAGGVAAPVNIMLSPAEIKNILQDAAPSLVIAGAPYLAKLDLPRLRQSGVEVAVIGGQGPEVPAYEGLLAGSGQAPPEPSVSDDDVALLIYTSGTTGRPKGVMLTHRNLLCDAWATCVARRLAQDEVSLVTAPLYQSGALGSMLGNVLRANTVVLLDGFTPGQVLETIERQRVTNALFVPTMLIKLLQYPELDRFDLSSMRTVIYGAAPMPVPVLKQVIARFGWELMGACGATETGPAYIAFLDREDHRLNGDPRRERRLASVGREGINAQVRIFDDQDRPLPSGQVGEIVVRGPHIMKGYWNKPQETAEALRGGWFHTGDLGMIDEDGYIFIVDRKKDMIITGGFNVYPREVEIALAEHPAVSESAVVGIPHEMWGETPRAYVVLRPGAPAPAEEELMAFLRGRLAPFKLPKGGFAFVDSLPRTASGKVLKRSLREQAGKEMACSKTT
ncbi:MAG: long-chain-fatty-acid--CoA ligase [Thermodesulfobacteriota bacterium]